MLMQWLPNTHEPLNKLPIVSHQGSDFSVGFWWSKFGHSFYVLSVGLCAFLGDMMSQIVDLIFKEFTLDWLGLQIVLSEVLKHNMQVMYVFLFHC